MTNAEIKLVLQNLVPTNGAASEKDFEIDVDALVKKLNINADITEEFFNGLD